jgi:hypothetical protein
MTKQIITIICFSFFCLNLHGQKSSDIIFWLDNSGSIDSYEWNLLTTTINEIIHGALDCNEQNKVSVIHYAGICDQNQTPKLWIESDFTNDESIALNYSRRGGVGTIMGDCDYAHETLDLIGDALDNVINSNILSPQVSLNHDPNKNLIVFLFTDAFRLSGGSCLVSVTNSALNNSLAFENYTEFKEIRSADFTVFLIAESNAAISASASIASKGGSYTGAIESFASDPEGPGSLPRKLVLSNWSEITEQNINQSIGNICESSLDLEIPNIISLSSQVGNNTFFVKNSGLSFFKCQILNRWGNLIYEYTDPDGYWNGKDYNGKIVSEGTYFYKVDYQLDTSEEWKTTSGFLMVVE